MPPWYPLFGEQALTIDEKNRLLIPSELRRKLEIHQEGQGLVLVRVGGRAWLYPQKHFEALGGQLRSSITPSLAEQQFLRALYGLSSEMPLDKQGRILLSERQIEALKLEHEIILVLAGDHMELWNRGDWNKEQAQLDKLMPDLMSQMGQQIVQPVSQ